MLKQLSSSEFKSKGRWHTRFSTIAKLKRNILYTCSSLNFLKVFSLSTPTCRKRDSVFKGDGHGH